MTALESMKNWISTCPLLSMVDKDFCIEYPETPDRSYALASNGTTIVKTYANGAQVRQHNLVLFNLDYTIEEASRLENSGFFEALSDWIMMQNRLRNMPHGTELEWVSITSGNGMLYNLDENGTTGMYQIQITATYIKE